MTFGNMEVGIQKMINKLIDKYNYSTVKYTFIALTTLTTILFLVSLAFAIVSYINFNTYTTLTM